MKGHAVRALLLDDERIYLEVAKGCLEALGAEEIFATSNQSEATEYLRKEDIDLVMTDLNMPGQDGLGFLRTLAQMEFGGAVIIVSGERSSIVGSAGAIGDRLGLNVCGALRKPLDPSVLKSAYELAEASVKQRQNVEPVAKLVPNGQLTPVYHYQPQIDLRTGDLIGAEALLRAIDQKGSLFGPSEMLNTAESAYECFALTERLFEIFCSDIVQLRNKGFSNRFSFNVDAVNLEFPQFAEMLMEATSRHKLNTKGIVIELTESQLPNDETWLLEVIARLSIAGFEVAMDDFSTGASNFSLLRAGAFEELKLDVGLVQSSAIDISTEKYIANTIQIANELKMRVVAEGVETEGDLHRMKQLGVTCVQGFLFAKPAASRHLKMNYFTDGNEARAAS